MVVVAAIGDVGAVPIGGGGDDVLVVRQRRWPW